MSRRAAGIAARARIVAIMREHFAEHLAWPSFRTITAQIARDRGVPEHAVSLGHLGYHLSVLAADGLIEQVGVEGRYRLTDVMGKVQKGLLASLSRRALDGVRRLEPAMPRRYATGRCSTRCWMSWWRTGSWSCALQGIGWRRAWGCAGD